MVLAALTQCTCPSLESHYLYKRAYLCDDVSDLSDEENATGGRIRRQLNNWNLAREEALGPWSLGRRTYFPDPRVEFIMDWHISQAHRESTGLLGLPHRVNKGPPIPEGATRERHLEILTKHGYRVITQETDRPMMLYDAGGTGIGLISPPRHSDSFAAYIGETMESLAPLAKKTAGGKRGDFLILEAGSQKGGGTILPTQRAHPTVGAREASKWLLGRPQHNIDLFRHYFPRTANYYQNTVEQMQYHIGDLPLPVSMLPFTSMTFNIGRQCICKPHLDSLNLSFGLCSICPVGVWDHTLGGHLVLHDLRRILQVKPGSICFIPSSIISHGNVPIGEFERRQALTGYTPGSYFKFVEENFQNVASRSLQEKLSVGAERWARGIGFLPNYSEIVTYN